MSLKEQTYWVIHLKNGVSLYTADEFKLDPEPIDRPGRALVGLDGELYEFPQDTIMLVHRSTPEARAFYVQLTVGIKEEMQVVQQAMMQQAMAQAQAEAKQQAESGEGLVDSAVDRVTRGLSVSRTKPAKS